MRPANETEQADATHFMCAATPNTREVLIQLPGRDPYHFAFDDVLQEETGQAEVFETVGAPVVDNCLSGYNSSVFAYGQTGAGKTHTMTGRVAGGGDAAAQEQVGDAPGSGVGRLAGRGVAFMMVNRLSGCSQLRGLAPRVFEYLFERIESMQEQQGRDRLKFCCRCSMLEIYNEVITDLLNPTATNLQVREDVKRGCYVEGLSEEIVQNVEDAMRLLRRGAEHRHVGETRLNRESSRSHSVFTCVVERVVVDRPGDGGGDGGGDGMEEPTCMAF
ncbi:Kinesin-like protein [Monoraphidium neglectum]|uniref:Kinesin-like protein n=1 Tax=Monoraphidium neglectum TaxID=145388 RepID=A0A0D2L9N3_9CHLO|nr:Kinesin-like protein [Monoraphidium neglectum]KIZ03519.1 Kinesin-like protein [Monoraphidium neglectum]|eukprot:XP_013902538.1 Kinesin-like protein [Monoraphidium neglectum]